MLSGSVFVLWHIEASVLRQSCLPETLHCIVWPTPTYLLCDLYVDCEMGRCCVATLWVTVCTRDVLGVGRFVGHSVADRPEYSAVC